MYRGVKTPEMTELKKYIPQCNRLVQGEKFHHTKKCRYPQHIFTSEWPLLVAIDGCDNHGLLNRVVAGEEESVFPGAQRTPKRIISAVRGQQGLGRLT